KGAFMQEITVQRGWVDCLDQVRLIALVAALSVCGLYSVARAQLPVGSISGVVRDASGAVIPAATVTATNRQTGMVRTGEASSNGRFTIPALPVGDYDVKAEAPAFTAQLKQGLTVAIGQETVDNFSLAVGTVTEAITVEAEAPLVQTTSGS